MKKKIIFLALMLLSITTVFAQTSWYVDNQNGSNSNNGTSPDSAVHTVEYLLTNDLIQPQDTVFILGQYNNPSYDPSFNYGGDADRANPHIWHKENTIRINNLHGQENQYITFKPYDNSTIIKGDGANIIRMTNSSYISIDGFEIEGEVDNITLDEAEGVYTDGMQFLYLAAGTVDPLNPPIDSVLFRVNSGTTEAAIDAMTFPIIGSNLGRPSYIDTRGIYVSNSNHIELKNNKIHHMPGGGLRVSSSSYTNIYNNELYRCSARSYSGTHALVVTKAKEGEANTTDDAVYSIKIYQNYVHDNYNELFSWVGTKSFIVARIDEGKGISLQRNNLDPWINGNKRILVENNLCVWNGFSGVHSNTGYHIDFRHNTCYMNSYTNSVTYANTTQQGNNIGISCQGGSDIRVENNISVIDTDWNGFALSSGQTTNLVVKNNLIFGNNGTLTEDSDVTDVDVNTIIQDPLFVDAASQNFNLLFDSPAKNTSSLNFSPTIDYLGNNRDATPDRGAFEFIPVNSITVQGQGGVSTITTDGGTLQMEATLLPANATDGTYIWSVTNGTGSATIDANGILTAAGNGTVTVTATANDGSGAMGTTVITISNQTVGVNERETNESILYPNPTTDFINISSSKEISEILIRDLSGRLIKSVRVLNIKNKKIDLSNINQGLYFITTYNKGKLLSQKIIVVE